MKILYSLLVAASLVACKGTPEVEVKSPPSQKGQTQKAGKSVDLNATSSSSQVTFSDPSFATLYEAYLSVKAALVNTDAAIAQEAAKDLAKATVAISEATEATKNAIQVISTQTDTKAQRQAFETVSQEIEVLLADKVTAGTIYKQYCPMAFNGKGAYWLSDSKEVRNPYFGDQMLKCGVVDSEIE